VQNAGFTPNLIYRMDPHPSGTVIAQQPLGATKADKGSTVTLTVSQGPGNTTVPSVSFLSRSAAISAIKQAQLKVSRVQLETSGTIPPNDATRSDPVAGASLPVGSGVTLFVSSGPPNVNVPDVTGESQSAAAATLKNAGFSVASSGQTSTTVTPGNVISQNPAGGTSVPPGSTVTIVVAQAAPNVNVPGVTGQKEAAARSTLTAAGFTVSTQSRDVTNRAQAGVVLSQSPTAGSSASKGSGVTIVIGHFTPSTTTTSSSTTHTSPTTTSTTTR
jgi:serine/threonine-protein kinase